MAEWGTYQSGIYTTVAATQAEAESLVPEPGVVYEHRITLQEPVTGAIITLVEQAILAIQQTFSMIKVTYWKADENEIVYQFMVPSGVTGLFPPIWAIIVIAIAILSAIAIISWVVFRVDVFGIGTLIKLIPGLIVTTVGGVLTSVLPGKAKIAGVVPIGMGLLMMVTAILPPTPPKNCGQYTTQPACETAGCHWWSDNTCHEIEEGAVQVVIMDIKGT